MYDPKTVEGCNEVYDPLYRAQKEGVARMRASLLACPNGTLTRQALQNITSLRVSHQIGRILKYLEMMDQLEEQMYSKISDKMEDIYSRPADDPMTDLGQLIAIQKSLQDIMLTSHKLLEPYLNMSDYAVVDASEPSEDNSNIVEVMDAEARDSLRTKAQAVLVELNESNNNRSTC